MYGRLPKQTWLNLNMVLFLISGKLVELFTANAFVKAKTSLYLRIQSLASGVNTKKSPYLLESVLAGINHLRWMILLLLML